jgi:hypothetical protein
MNRNESTQLYFDEKGELKIGIGGGTKAIVIADMPKSSITYTFRGNDTIISQPISEIRTKLLDILKRNFPGGKVSITYDGEIDTSGNSFKAHISRIIICDTLTNQ